MATTKKNVKKVIAWISKTTTLHVRHSFLYISLPPLHDYERKMPNFTFYGGRKQGTAKFSFSFWICIWFLGIRLKKSLLAFDKVNELEYKRRFRSGGRSRRRRGVLKFPIYTWSNRLVHGCREWANGKQNSGMASSVVNLVLLTPHKQQRRHETGIQDKC